MLLSMSFFVYVVHFAAIAKLFVSIEQIKKRMNFQSKLTPHLPVNIMSRTTF